MRQAEPPAVRMNNLLSQRAAAPEIGAQKSAAPGRDWLIAARPQRKLNPISDESQRALAGRGTHQPMMDHAYRSPFISGPASATIRPSSKLKFSRPKEAAASSSARRSLNHCDEVDRLDDLNALVAA